METPPLSLAILMGSLFRPCDRTSRVSAAQSLRVLHQNVLIAQRPRCHLPVGGYPIDLTRGQSAAGERSVITNPTVYLRVVNPKVVSGNSFSGHCAFLGQISRTCPTLSRRPPWRCTGATM